MINFRTRQDGNSYNGWLKAQLSEAIGKETENKRKAELKRLNKKLKKKLPSRPKEKVKKI